MDGPATKTGEVKDWSEVLLTSGLASGDRRGRVGVHLAFFQSNGQLPLYRISLLREGGVRNPNRASSEWPSVVKNEIINSQINSWLFPVQGE